MIGVTTCSQRGQVHLGMKYLMLDFMIPLAFALSLQLTEPDYHLAYLQSTLPTSP